MKRCGICRWPIWPWQHRLVYALNRLGFGDWIEHYHRRCVAIAREIPEEDCR